MNIKELMNKRKELMSKKKDKDLILRDINREIDIVDAEIKKRMLDEGLSTSSSDGITATIKENISPKVRDWDALYSYIKKNNLFSLLHRRISSTTFNNMVASGDIPDGVDVDSYTSISFRNKE